MLLTLDLATVLGWTKGAVEDTKFKSGYFRLPSTKNDIGAFAIAYDDWLNFNIDGVTDLVFEAPILPRKTQLATIRKLYGLCYHTELLCTKMGIKCYEANLSSVKKTIGGHGRADKDDMVAAVRGYGYDVKENNEADAIAVRLYTIMTRHKDLAASFGLDMGLLGSKPQKAPIRLQDALRVRPPVPELRASQLLWPED